MDTLEAPEKPGHGINFDFDKLEKIFNRLRLSSLKYRNYNLLG